MVGALHRVAPGTDRGGIGIVLAGGAARGAYEAGVLQYIVEEVGRELEAPLPIEIVCGSSVGAVNACLLAAFADEPATLGERIIHPWSTLQLREILRPDACELLAMTLGLFGGTPRRHRRALRGGLLKPAAFERLISSSVPFERIERNLRARLISAVTISATHVATGRTVVFVAGPRPRLPAWHGDPDTVVRPAHLRPEHALASAAIPILLPAVEIAGELYCDGGLRQNLPLAPAHRLGAGSLVVISPHHVPVRQERDLEIDRERFFGGPLYLLGKTLNALLVDRVDGDIDRLERINSILRAGIRRYGPGFVDAINDEMGLPPDAHLLRPIPTVVVRASEDVGRMSGEFVRSPEFARRAPGLIGRVLRHIAEAEGAIEADLLSYLLFDGEFTGRLVELGRRDARAQHGQLYALFLDALAERPQILSTH